MNTTHTTPKDFRTRKEAIIPAWAKAVRLVANGIDGWPPIEDRVYPVEEFLAEAEQLQLRAGSGEWDVLVYGVSDSSAGCEVRPYGASNPYRQLRSRVGERVKPVARLSYMRRNWYEFRKEELWASTKKRGQK